MATTQWVYDRATGQFLRGGFFDPTFDPVTEGVAVFQDADPNPDIRLDRYDVQTGGKRRASPVELVAYDLQQLDSIAAAQIQENPALICGLLALHAKMLGRIPTADEQASVFLLAKAFHKALMTANTFPLPPEATASITV